MALEKPFIQISDGKTIHTIQACICKEIGISCIQAFIHSGNHALSIHSLDVAWMLH